MPQRVIKTRGCGGAIKPSGFSPGPPPDATWRPTRDEVLHPTFMLPGMPLWTANNTHQLEYLRRLYRAVVALCERYGAGYC